MQIFIQYEDFYNHISGICVRQFLVKFGLVEKCMF